MRNRRRDQAPPTSQSTATSTWIWAVLRTGIPAQEGSLRIVHPLSLVCRGDDHLNTRGGQARRIQVRLHDEPCAEQAEPTVAGAHGGIPSRIHDVDQRDGRRWSDLVEREM